MLKNKSLNENNNTFEKLKLTIGAIPELSYMPASQAADIPSIQPRKMKRPKIFASTDTMHKLIEKVNSSIDVKVKEKIEKENSKVAHQLEQEQQRLSRKKHKEELVKKAKESIRIKPSTATQTKPQRTSSQKKKRVTFEDDS